jgi:hypothetical protein
MLNIYLFLLVSFTFNLMTGYYVSYKRNVKENDKIYDLGFKILPNLEKYDYVNDYILIIPILFLIYHFSGWTKNKQNTFLITMGVMYLFRSLSNYVTTFPSMKKCDLKPPFGFCNDFMFSGHTTFNIVISYFVNSILWPIWPIITSILTIATREHYSVDVLIAWLIFGSLQCRI